MKRGLSLLLIGLGVLLLVLAPLVKFVVAPHVVKAPLDINAEIDAGGDGFNYLDATVGKVVPISVSVTRHILGDVSAGNKNVAVYDESLCLTRDDDHKGLGCQRAGSPLLLTNSSDRVAFDRISGEPVTGNVCGANADQDCKANVNGDTSIKHTGLGYKFPIDTKKQTYQFFDTVVGKSFPAEYKGTEKKGGLDCYKFVQVVTNQPAYTNGVLPSTYTNTRTVWVEPTTGVIVDGSEDLNQVLTGRATLDPSSELRDPALAGLTALQGLLSFTDPTIKSQAKLATDNLPKIHAVRLYLPLGALVLGLICVVAGVLLRRRDSGPAGASTESDDSSGDSAALFRSTRA
jgi:hypothetical protein